MQRGGDTAEVAGHLPGAAGFPLRDSAAGRTPDSLCQVVLVSSAFSPDGLDTYANFGRFTHEC